jgi:hypothetical protein
MADDPQLAGQLVACPNCMQSVQMPGTQRRPAHADRFNVQPGAAQWGDSPKRKKKSNAWIVVVAIACVPAFLAICFVIGSAVSNGSFGVDAPLPPGSPLIRQRMLQSRDYIQQQHPNRIVVTGWGGFGGNGIPTAETFSVSYNHGNEKWIARCWWVEWSQVSCKRTKLSP